MTDYLIIDAHVGIDPVMSHDAMRNELWDNVRNHGARGVKIQSHFLAGRYTHVTALHTLAFRVNVC